MKKVNLIELEPSKKLNIEDLLAIVIDKNEEIDLSKKLKLKLKKSFQEQLWNKAKDLIDDESDMARWTKLARLVSQSKNSLLRFAERSRAKPLSVYKSLIELLKENNIKISFKKIEENTEYIVKEKNKIKSKFPITWYDLGLCKIREIKVNIPVVKWEELSKYPKEKFRLKNFVIKVKIPNPYWRSDREKQRLFKKLGKDYVIDFTKKVYLHLKENAKRELLNEFYKNIPGINLKTKIQNGVKLLNHYSFRSLDGIMNKELSGVPLIVILKILKQIGSKKYTLKWIEKN